MKVANKLMRELKKFDFEGYKRCESYNPHHFPIGLWASWWLGEGRSSKGTIEEEKRIYTDKSWLMADLILIDKKERRIGIVEVENSYDKFTKKLDTFSWFETDPRNKFDYSSKDAKFCILMMWAEVDDNGNYTHNYKRYCGVQVRKDVIKKMKIESKNSKMYWVAFITKWLPDEKTYLGYEIIIMKGGKQLLSKHGE